MAPPEPAAARGAAQPRIFVPEDKIVSKGEWGDEMFVIYRGVVLLVELSETEGRPLYMKDGDYFGEIAALTGGQRFMSIKAVTYCHLYSLQQKLLEVLLHSKTHPESRVVTPPTRLSHTTTAPATHSR